MAQAIELRKAGATYQQIADRLGYASAASAAGVVKHALDRMIREPAEELRSLEYERLNHILLTLWPRVQAGELAAVDRCLRIMERIAVLMGVSHQAPQQLTQHNVIVIDGRENDYIEGLRKLRDQAKSALEERVSGEVIDARIVDVPSS